MLVYHADRRDLLDLVAIEKICFSGDSDMLYFEEFCNLLKDGDCSTIAMRENSMITGYGMVRFKPKSSTAWLYSLCSITQKAWIILENLEIAAKIRNMHYIRAEVRINNFRAITFYERNGYRLSRRYRGGRLHDWYKDGQTALVYIKDLR